MWQKILKFVLRHKVIAVIIAMILVGGNFFGYQKIRGRPQEIRYVLSTVEKGTIVTSVSGSGQVSVLNQVDVKSKASGDLVFVGARNGQEVKSGIVLAQIDAREAQKTVRDAEQNLEAAKLSLVKLKKPTDALTLLQAENALAQAKDSLVKLKKPTDALTLLQAENALTNVRDNLEKLKLSQQTDYQKAQETKQKAEDDLKKAYDDGFNVISNAFLDLPTAMAGLQDILFSYSFRSNQSNIDYYSDMAKIYDEKAVQYNKDAYDKYQTARKMYDGNFQDYKSASRYSSTDVIESLINETYETAKSIAEAVKSANNLIQFYEDKLTERNLRPATLADTHLSTLNTYTGKTNTHLLNLLSIKRTLQTDKEAITNAEGDLKEMDQNNPLDMSAAEAAVKEKEDSLAKLKAGTDPLDIQSAERSVAEKTESLAKLKAGTDPLDIQAQELTIKQRQNALLDAKEKLADYFVHAPFDGVVAAIDIKKGDPISASTVIATFITKQRVAEVTLNEVDVARAEIGQKATLTFDAVPDLSITGEVAGIDTIGTVSQGVVSYTVRITFDTQDEQVKPGMSVSANIIIEAKSDVLLVPNSAIKSQGSGQYVEVAGGQVEQARVVSQTGVILPQPPRRQTVEIGISNDESTEITTGLKEGDRVITQAITSKSSAASTSSSQNRGFDAGMMRMMR